MFVLTIFVCCRCAAATWWNLRMWSCCDETFKLDLVHNSDNMRLQHVRHARVSIESFPPKLVQQFVQLSRRKSSARLRYAIFVSLSHSPCWTRALKMDSRQVLRLFIFLCTHHTPKTQQRRGICRSEIRSRRRQTNGDKMVGWNERS